MTLIQNPNATPSRNISGHSGHGFIGFLLVFTWAIIAMGFVAVKLGMLQPPSATSSLSGQLITIENRLSTVSSRLAALEKNSPNHTAELTAEQPAATDADTTAAPDKVAEETTPAENAGTPAPKDSAIAKPETPVEPEAKNSDPTTPAEKPKTENSDASKDNHVGLEKKNLNFAMNVIHYQ